MFPPTQWKCTVHLWRPSAPTSIITFLTTKELPKASARMPWPVYVRSYRLLFILFTNGATDTDDRGGGTSSSLLFPDYSTALWSHFHSFTFHGLKRCQTGRFFHCIWHTFPSSILVLHLIFGWQWNHLLLCVWLSLKWRKARK